MVGLAEALKRLAMGPIGAVEISETEEMPSEVPDVAIGCGSKSRKILRALRKRGAFTVYVQDPRRRYSVYDLVVAPEHDGVERHNAVSMIGSPTRFVPKVLRGIAEAPMAAPEGFPEKRAAFLIGGTSSRFAMDADAVEEHIAAAEALLAEGFGLMVTTSRRTPGAAARRWRELGARDDVWLYEGVGENPYGTFLATADVVLVTEDSTNMLSEACGAGVPVFRLSMNRKSGSGEPGKFAQLYAALEDRCGVVVWPGAVPELGRREPLDETSRVARLVWEALPEGVKG